MLDYADTIKSMVDMRQVCDLYGISVNERHKAMCPFHSDRRPSMHIYQGRRGYFCYVCNEGGSVIDFAIKYFHLPFKQAISKLNEDFRLGLPIGQELTTEERRRAEEQSIRRREELWATKRKRERLVMACEAARDLWISLDISRMRSGPQRPEDPITAEYAYAVKNIDGAAYRLELAQVALHEFDQRQKENQERSYADRQKQKSGEMIAKKEIGGGSSQCA